MINTAYYCDDGFWFVQTEHSNFKAPCDALAFYLPVRLFYEDGSPIFTADSLDMLRRADDYCYYRKLREEELGLRSACDSSDDKVNRDAYKN